MRVLLIASAVVLMAAPAFCGIVGFVSNPTGNSTDFASFVSTNGGTLNTITFNTHPTGALQPNFYSGQGVTLAGTGDFTTVQSSAGPADGNTGTVPLSSGEGLHAVSNVVGGTVVTGTFTVSFATPVLAAGIFIVDLFNPGGVDVDTIQAFSGTGGTGSSLGSFNAASFNFQNNNMYFVGIGSTTGGIGSIVITSPGTAGDRVALDNLEYATVGSSSVPEPGTWSLLALGAAAIAVGRKAGFRSQLF